MFDSIDLRRGKMIVGFANGYFPAQRMLDVGSPNPLGRALRIIELTLPGDLNQNFSTPHNQYDFILFSEVLEHLMNPYLAMKRIYELLSDKGVCVVSTPVARWGWYTSIHHFVEYKPEKLKIFFEYMGFEVLKYRTFQFYDWRYPLHGIRPLLRYVFQRNQLLLLRRKEIDHD